MFIKRIDRLLLLLVALFLATCPANGLEGDLADYGQDVTQQGKEYITPFRLRIVSASLRRRLQQEAPSLCGKLGTYVPSYFTQHGSMAGVSISSNADGSYVLVGAPLNTQNVSMPGGAMLLTSQNSKTCEYKARPVWRPKDSYKYFGAQVAMSEDGSTMAVMDGVEAIRPRPNCTMRTTDAAAVAAAGGGKSQVIGSGRADPMDSNRRDKSDKGDKSDKKAGKGASHDIKISYRDNPPGRDHGSISYSNSRPGASSSSSDYAQQAMLPPCDNATIAAAGPAGNRPVVHIFRQTRSEPFRYLQKLDCELRQALALSMAISMSKNGDVILVSFAIGESFPDKRGSAQVFYWDKDLQKYKFIQDLAMLNQPAGVSVHYGATSQISSDGQYIAVTSAAFASQEKKFTYMYKLDPATERYRIVTAINSGEIYADPWPLATSMGVNVDNALGMTQTGKYVLRVENSRLVVYESSGKDMTMNWLRRCQIAPPSGYIFRTSSGALSIVEVGGGIVKIAAGAYMGDLENSPEQMAVFLYYLDGPKQGSCPWRPAEKHTHPDPFSSYGAGVYLTPNGKLLIVGAPTAWDNNMDNQVGAVYMIDVSSVEDDGLEAKTVTLAANDKAGCINGRDANGNFCVEKQAGTILCKDIEKKDGTIIHYGPPGCTPTPPPPSFWTASVPGEVPGVFKTSSVSAYSSVNPSIKGGVGVPVGQNIWLGNQVKAATDASYFGVPTTAITKPKESIVSAAGWPTSVQPALGGIPKPEGVAPAPPGINVRSVLSGLGTVLGGLPQRNGVGGAAAALPAVPGRTTGLGLPQGAVITNPGVLQG